MDLTRVVTSPRALPRWAVASLVGNIGIVVTGGLVRLTGSGLGCPTWPRCTENSFVSHPALGVHGAIEFGNRLLTLVLILIAVLTFVSALVDRDPARSDRGGRRRDLRWLTAAMALGIPAQGVIGGLTVLTGLNPYLVGLHLLLSMVLISLAVWLVRLTRQLTPRPVPGPLAALPRVTLALLWMAVLIGTVLTGSGPHAGDDRVPRNGLDGMLLTHLHSGTVYATIAATLLCLALLRSRAALLLLAVEAVQATIGIAQYNLGLPIGLVALHLLGAALAIAAATNLMLSVRRLRTAPNPAAGERRPTSLTSA
ncbi:MAG TPA: COX15/CtaA family protein [Propionibacteriaceae bacterium]|nr:COX15/CtaA family protein [Propionibacteriaceae bacterium]